MIMLMDNAEEEVPIIHNEPTEQHPADEDGEYANDKADNEADFLAAFLGFWLFSVSGWSRRSWCGRFCSWLVGWRRSWSRSWRWSRSWSWSWSRSWRWIWFDIWIIGVHFSSYLLLVSIKLFAFKCIELRHRAATRVDMVLPERSFAVEVMNHVPFTIENVRRIIFAQANVHVVLLAI